MQKQRTHRDANCEDSTHEPADVGNVYHARAVGRDLRISRKRMARARP
jgi:hypothetical protein